ncbi:MAG: aminotransferase class V-fold PLP-dependent enzyme, partial [bacterium]|nr:aminotransferase class V-fold PLP-dependent enzyme [bacterium]
MMKFEFEKTKHARFKNEDGKARPFDYAQGKLYFDYAATTPVDPRVLASMQPYFSGKFGNPGSLHSFGQEAITALDSSREHIAAAVGADFNNVVFTGSATEANNLALRGLLKGLRIQNLGLRDSLNPQSSILNPKIIISSIEHESILETARDLEKEGVEVIVVGVNKCGVVNVKEVEQALDDRTILVSIMYANNEIGTIQPIAEISKVIQNF